MPIVVAIIKPSALKGFVKQAGFHQSPNVNCSYQIERMTSPYYPDPANFKPTQESMLRWLNTRKPSDNDQVPGLFTTVRFSSDQSWTIIAALIELMALCLTIYGALSLYQQNQNKANLFVAIVAVVLFIAFDVIGVLLHGGDRSQKVVNRSKMKISKDPAAKQLLIQDAKKVTNKEFFGVLFLVLSALIKIAAVILLFGALNATLPMFVVLFLFYVVVVYIHVAHTGYWLSARQVSKRFKKEYNEYVQSKIMGTSADEGLAKDRKVFTSPNSLPGGVNEFQNGRQKVVFIEKSQDEHGNASFTLALESRGVMWDEDVVSLLSNFTAGSHIHKAVLDAAILLQLQQINIVPGNLGASQGALLNS